MINSQFLFRRRRKVKDGTEKDGTTKKVKQEGGSFEDNW